MTVSAGVAENTDISDNHRKHHTGKAKNLVSKKTKKKHYTD